MQQRDAASQQTPAKARSARLQDFGQAPVSSDSLLVKKLPFGSLAFLGAGLSLITCYATVIVSLTGPLFGISGFEFNPHLQAVMMWVFVLLAVLGLARDRRHHQNSLPLSVGGAAFALIVGTLYTFYDDRIVILGYVLLVAAAFLNQNTMLVRLNEAVQNQARELVELNDTLEQRVERQVTEIEGLARLKRFLGPEVANLVTSAGKESLLDSHRRYIACLFCDIRDFTRLSESIEPEEVMEILQTYHEQLGRLVAQRRGTIGYRAGDGLMVFFNDPIPCEAPVLEAVRLAIEMRDAFAGVHESWDKLGYRFGFGVGVASGYATLGVVGFEGRFDYTAIGNVVNLAARLCDRAEDGQILIDRRARADIEDCAEFTPVGALDLKGFARPIDAYKLRRLTHGN